MIKLGEKQKLTVVKQVEFGAYLAPTMEDVQEKVLLPVKQVPENVQIGDELDVFLYKDSKDRLITTTKEPKLTMGQIAELTVSQVNKFGAFLDWGLEKDLMLPYKQQMIKVQQGDKVLVTLYIDKSDRLCATMNVYPALRTDSPYKKDDQVSGRVYTIIDEFGALPQWVKECSAKDGVPLKYAYALHACRQQAKISAAEAHQQAAAKATAHSLKSVASDGTSPEMASVYKALWGQY